MKNLSFCRLFGNSKDEPSKNFLLRDGLTPATKNIMNVRYKDEVNEKREDVGIVEEYLKDNIDYGFSENAIEELLYFDENGKLVKSETVPEFEQIHSEIASSNYEDGDYSIKMKFMN